MTEDAGSEWMQAMRAGAFERAWALSDQVLARRHPATRDDPAEPYHKRWVWDGRRFDGEHALVRCYHGLGDTIQFARYLPLLARRAAAVTLEVQPRLATLLGGIADLAIVPFDIDHPEKPHACDIEITELPYALRAHPDAVAIPYLHASPALLPEGTIGLCYAGGDWDPARSLPAPLLAALPSAAPAITLVAEPTTLPVLNPDGCPFDLDATAALVAACDLVITVDTMIAHLAGALGRPTWLLLKHDPDWRWPLAGTTTAWYPTMRLYRQPEPGDWSSVIQQVAADLAVRTASPRQRGAR